jgi:hypothetical protein
VGGLAGMIYEKRLATFLFARALHKTEEFLLASNVDGVGAFDDLVFRYRLKETDVWKTCFIQLKHKEEKGTTKHKENEGTTKHKGKEGTTKHKENEGTTKHKEKEGTTKHKEKECTTKHKEKDGTTKHKEKEGTIPFSSLIKMAGDFSLLKYFESYCQIKSKACTHQNLKHCGPFDDFKFVIYTNAKMESNPALQVEDSGPLNILSSGTNCGKNITFVEAVDTQVFKFFEELSKYRDCLVELDNLFVRGTLVGKEIEKEIENFQKSFTNKAIKGTLESLKSELSKDGVTALIKKVAKCDFTLYKEFLSKVKIFHSQSNEKSLGELIKKELIDVCKASHSVAESIYTKFEEGFSQWCELNENVVWLSKNAQLWQDVKKHLITELKKISEPELQKLEACGTRFNEQHVQRLCEAIKQNTILNIVTKSDIRYLQQLKTYQALNNLCYTNSLFIPLKCLKYQRK